MIRRFAAVGAGAVIAAVVSVVVLAQSGGNPKPGHCAVVG
jgi:hypothetical protein